MTMRSLVIAFITFWVGVTTPTFSFAECPERQPCKGCGCKGGPGYRGPDGKCVGFKNLEKICGSPPELRCRFENAPGTGANKECALEKKAKKKST